MNFVQDTQGEIEADVYFLNYELLKYQLVEVCEQAGEAVKAWNLNLKGNRLALEVNELHYYGLFSFGDPGAFLVIVESVDLIQKEFLESL